MDPENNKWLQKIDAYLRGELSEEELNVFKKQLDQNPQLKEEVTFRKQIERTLKEESKLSDFRQLQSDIEAELNQKPPSSSFKWVYILLSVFVISAISFYYWPQSQDELPQNETPVKKQPEQKEKPPIQEVSPLPEVEVPSSKPVPPSKPSKTKEPIAADTSPKPEQLLALADQYDQAELIGQLDLNIERSDAAQDSLYGIAVYNFNQQNYPAALSTLLTFQAKHPQQKELLYPLGICYLSTEPKKALDLLKRAFDYNSVNREQWHLALAYLKTGATEEARKNLQEIIKESLNTEDLYVRKAKQLLLEIDAMVEKK